jgi:hypothetical protein
MKMNEISTNIRSGFYGLLQIVKKPLQKIHWYPKYSIRPIRREGMKRAMNMQRPPIHPLRRAKGNTIAEYVLIGVLVLTAGIFAMMAFGKSFAAHIAGIKSDTSDHSQQAAYVEAKIQADAAMASVSTMPGLNHNNNGNGSSSGDALAQTTGANGDTMNGTIQGSTGQGGSGVQQPLSETDQLKLLMKDLANQAHKIAQLEAMLATISSYSSGDTDKFQSTTIYYQGQTVNAYQLSYALTHGGAIIELQQKKDAILASSASEDVKSTVSTLTDNVVQTANNAGNQVQSGSTQVDKSASVETDTNASKICAAGGNEDNGKKCGIVDLVKEKLADKFDDKKDDKKKD